MFASAGSSLVLKVQLAVDAEVAVGAGEGVADARADGGDAVIVLVVRLEVSSTELYVFIDTVFEAEADAAGVDHERHVVHVGVGELIAGDLDTSRDGEAVGDVPFSTAKILVGTTVKQLLGVVVPMGLGVEEVVITEVDADIVGDVPHGSDSELGGRVFIDLLA